MRSKADLSRPLPTTLDWTTSPLVSVRDHHAASISLPLGTFAAR
jgi:hypothetical protein